MSKKSANGFSVVQFVYHSQNIHGGIDFEKYGENANAVVFQWIQESSGLLILC